VTNATCRALMEQSQRSLYLMEQSQRSLCLMEQSQRSLYLMEQSQRSLYLHNTRKTNKRKTRDKIQAFTGEFFGVSFISFVLSFLSLVYLHILCPHATYSSTTLTHAHTHTHKPPCPCHDFFFFVFSCTLCTSSVLGSLS
jgi:hypothetical protein